MRRVVQVFLILNLILSQTLSSQESSGQKINILSPNAESFKIYGDIPVSLYTGIPQISIPLQTIKTDYLNINIDLSYHASGFKPENHPSWVGLGWNLNVGGVINREIKGELDEMRSDNYAINGLGYYYAYNILNNDNWYTPNDPNATNTQFQLRYMDIDTQPDVFSFNFLGYSGKFYLNHLGEWKVQCDAPIKIIFNKEDIGNGGSMFMSEHFRKFTIIDEKGVKYIFGGENAIEYSQSMFTNKNTSYSYAKGWQATSWYLKEIIPPVGEPISFNYERGPYQSTFSCSGANKPWKRGYQSSSVYDYVLGGYIYGGASGSIISPIYLASIDCPSNNLTITFDTSKSNDLIYPETNYRDFFYKDNNSIPSPDFLAFDAVANIPYFTRNIADKNKAELSTGSGQFKDRFIWLKLDKITFKYKNNNVETISKTISFSYNENVNIRRKLSTVTVSFPSSNDPEIYSLEYNQSLPPDMIREPEYLSEYTDHWGYANNKFMWKEEDMKNAPKAPAKERAKLGVLSKIIYPTKGYSMFVYENHDYSAYVPRLTNTLEETNLTTVGGLRIKKIISVSDSKTLTMKEYIYNRVNRVGVSSGILHAYPSYYTSNGILFDNSGAHVTYSSVIEKYENKSFKATHFITEAGGERLGESISPVFDDLPVFLAGEWIDIPSSRKDIERGKVSDEYYCDSIGKIYKSIHYSYTNIGKNISNSVRTLDPVYMKSFYPNPYGDPIRIKKDASAYYYYCYSNKLSRMREIQYNKNSTSTYGNFQMPSSNNIIMSSKTMEYDSNKQLIKESVVNSLGKINETNIKYPYTEQNTDISKKMVDYNIISYPVSQRKYIDGILQGGQDYTYSFLNNKHILLTSLKDVYRDNSSIIISECKYNSIGKLVEVKDRSDLYQTYLWDYNGKNVRLILDNVSLEAIKKEVSTDIIDCTAQITDWTSLAKRLRSVFPNSLIKSYDYDYKGNINKIVGPSSISENFTYDKNERLETVSDDSQRTLQKYTYNYKKDNLSNSVYLNEFTVLTAEKRCPTGYIPEGKPAKLEISAGTYLSTISQNDANKIVSDKHSAEIQAIADSDGKCIRYQEVTLLNTNNTDIMTSRAFVEGDELVLSYAYLNWTDYFRYYNYNVFYGAVSIAEIKDKSFIPQKTTFKEYEMYGSIWTIWTEINGNIYISLKSSTNPNQIPTWQEGFQVSGDIRFPLK